MDTERYDLSDDVFENGNVSDVEEEITIEREKPRDPLGLAPYSQWLIPEEERNDPNVERLPGAFVSAV